MYSFYIHMTCAHFTTSTTFLMQTVYTLLLFTPYIKNLRVFVDSLSSSQLSPSWLYAIWIFFYIGTYAVGLATEFFYFFLITTAILLARITTPINCTYLNITMKLDEFWNNFLSAQNTITSFHMESSMDAILPWNTVCSCHTYGLDNTIPIR